VAGSTAFTIRGRISLLYRLILLAFLALTCKLVYLQGFRSAQLSAAAAFLRKRVYSLEAARGYIYDRNGVPLAINADLESIYADPERIEDPQEVAATLARQLQLDPDKLAAKLRAGGRFVWVKRKVRPEIARKVKALDIRGVGMRLERKRIYPPAGSAFANVIGFAGTDNDGLEGLERKWDSILSGQPKISAHESGSAASPSATPPEVLSPSRGGRHLVLTIDARVQEIAAEELRLQCHKLMPKSATLTVLDPRTGDVLAMCSYPSFDPNHFTDAGPREWKNRSVWWTFEPGSILKPVLAAAALDAGVINLKDRFYCPGEIILGGTSLSCWGKWREKGHGWQTVAQVLANSCNIGAARIALKLGKQRYYDYLTRFGFGRLTGIDCLAERSGVVRPADEWSIRGLATAGFGQGLTVTSLQLACAASALVNGGVLRYPRIVKEVRNEDGSLFRAIEPRIVQRPIRPETSRLLIKMLERVVESGTGKSARIPGYRIGGKTGTAQKTEPGRPGYLPDRFIVSFWGAVPLPDPDFVVVVTLDEPHGEQTGSAAAAPVFKAVTKRLLKYYEIPPETPGT